MTMQEFDYQLRPRIVFAENGIERLGELARQLLNEPGVGQEKGTNLNRVLVVSDPGVVSAGIFDRGAASLLKSQLEVCGFHDFSENPTTKHVDLGLLVARDFQPHLIIGLGGGSSMDCAKGINFLFSCGGRMQDYWGVGKAQNPMLPLIGVPTTSGTGSEAQSFALISDAETHIKMACGDPKASCRIALLDPQLTLTMPSKVTALTGIDAITHTLETFVCNKRTPMSECYSWSAWERLSAGVSQVIANPSDTEGRGNMQLGACFAGMAIEASMLGAAHALANPLTATFGTPHGQAVGLMMPHVIRFNAPVVGDRYQKLVRLLSDADAKHATDASQWLVARMTAWLTDFGLHSRLRELPEWPTTIAEESQLIETLADSAVKQWTGTFNPRPLSRSDFVNLYRAAV
ncbi:MAG: iron-containing alcohol dehydrogenase [Pirellula sp.]|nr:iron-containing alcohol dehydrogenase [Pirellula sp.]